MKPEKFEKELSQEERKDLFLKALKENPNSCPADSYLIANKTYPEQGLTFINEVGADMESEHVVIGRAEHLFEEFKDDVTAQFPEIAKSFSK